MATFQGNYKVFKKKIIQLPLVSPKNQQSVRTVPLDNGTIELLQDYKAHHWKENDFNQLFSENTHAYLIGD